MTSSIRHLVFGSAVLLLAVAARADVRVVSAGGGAPYMTIQAAVNAANDGDVILVKPTGTYAGFTINDKALTVAGDSTTGFVAINSRITVQNLGASRTVVISRLRVQYPTPADYVYNSVPSLAASAISGQLRVEQCELIGRDGWWDPISYDATVIGAHAVSASSSAGGIVLSQCTLRGGAGGFTASQSPVYGYDGSNGGDALRIEGARVALDECSLTSGAGGRGFSFFGGDAGAGMHLQPGSLPTVAVASHSSFTGSNGGFCGDPFYPPYQSGDGGDGILVEPSTSVYLLDPTASGGIPGTWCCGTAAHPGTPGATGVGIHGSANTFAVSHVTMTAPAIVRAGSTMTLSISADPGDAIYLFESPRTSFIGQVSWRGYWLAKPIGPQPYTKPPTPLVVLPGTGSASLVLPAPALDAGVQGRTAYYQAYRVSPSGSLTLGGFAAVTVVQPGF